MFNECNTRMIILNIKFKIIIKMILSEREYLNVKGK